MPNFVPNKTWRDVVATSPRGTITMIRDGAEESGLIVGIRIDEKGGFMLIEQEKPSTETSWLKREPGIMSVIEIPLSVRFSEEGAETSTWHFTANHGGVVVTMYVG